MNEHLVHALRCILAAAFFIAVFFTCFRPLIAEPRQFVDQIDRGHALVCSDASGRWNCKTVPLEFLPEGVEEGTTLLWGWDVMIPMEFISLQKVTL